MPRKARAQLEEGESAQEVAAHFLSTDRIARRWAAVTLKVLGGWDLPQIREQVPGVINSSLSAWVTQLAAEKSLD